MVARVLDEAGVAGRGRDGRGIRHSFGNDGKHVDLSAQQDGKVRSAFQCTAPSLGGVVAKQHSFEQIGQSRHRCSPDPAAS